MYVVHVELGIWYNSGPLLLGCHAALVGRAASLPDLPYFTGAPVFQVISPVSRLKRMVVTCKFFLAV